MLEDMRMAAIVGILRRILRGLNVRAEWPTHLFTAGSVFNMDRIQEYFDLGGEDWDLLRRQLATGCRLFDSIYAIAEQLDEVGIDRAIAVEGMWRAIGPGLGFLDPPPAVTILPSEEDDHGVTTASLWYRIYVLMDQPDAHPRMAPIYTLILALADNISFTRLDGTNPSPEVKCQEVLRSDILLIYDEMQAFQPQRNPRDSPFRQLLTEKKAPYWADLAFPDIDLRCLRATHKWGGPRAILDSWTTLWQLAYNRINRSVPEDQPFWSDAIQVCIRWLRTAWSAEVLPCGNFLNPISYVARNQTKIFQEYSNDPIVPNALIANTPDVRAEVGDGSLWQSDTPMMLNNESHRRDRLAVTVRDVGATIHHVYSSLHLEKATVLTCAHLLLHREIVVEDPSQDDNLVIERLNLCRGIRAIQAQRGTNKWRGSQSHERYYTTNVERRTTRYGGGTLRTTPLTDGWGWSGGSHKAELLLLRGPISPSTFMILGRDQCLWKIVRTMARYKSADTVGILEAALDARPIQWLLDQLEGPWGNYTALSTLAPSPEGEAIVRIAEVLNELTIVIKNHALAVLEKGLGTLTFQKHFSVSARCMLQVPDWVNECTEFTVVDGTVFLCLHQGPNLLNTGIRRTWLGHIPNHEIISIRADSPRRNASRRAKRTSSNPQGDLLLTSPLVANPGEELILSDSLPQRRNTGTTPNSTTTSSRDLRMTTSAENGR